MDGLLVIDKPAGPTSHDVVARVRRVLRERRVGHTGTLDPAATGVLPLVVGRATRLARFLTAGDKSYEAVIRLGFATDTGDASGARIGGADTPPALPSREAIERALDAFRGTFLQQPPAYSARKIGGRRSYELARARDSTPLVASLSSVDNARGEPEAVEERNHEPPRPLATPVRVHRLDLVGVEIDRVTVSLDCSAGFYVRSLAHDLGALLGVGGHLTALRRTSSGGHTLAEALPLDIAERDRAAAAAHIIPVSRMLLHLPSATLTADGVRRARHGNDLGPRDIAVRDSRTPNPASLARLLDPAGDLVGLAEPSASPGLLHPFVVLV